MTTNNKGRSIELFFVNGNPDGMLTATIPFQWSGHVLVSGRTQIKEALKRPEASRPGVYLLTGESEKGQVLYVGEGDDISRRIRDHDSKKDWWSTAIFITSSPETPLNKSHILYIESQLIQKARSVNKYTLDNGKDMSLPSLSEAATAHMEDFIENIYLVLPALKFDFFQEDTRASIVNQINTNQENSPVFVLDASRQNIMAKARLEDDKFIVEKGSQARLSWVGEASIDSGYAKIYKELVERGILIVEGNARTFTANYKFNSPSAAASIIKGRMANGAKAWKLEGTSKTYKQWENEELLNEMLS